MHPFFPHHLYRGQIILLALVFFGIFITVSTALVSYLTAYSRAGRITIASAQALMLAEAGLDHAVYRLNQGTSYTGETATLGGGSFTTTVGNINANTKQITVTGNVPSAGMAVLRTIKANIGITTSAISFYYGAQTGEGGIEMGQNSRIEGTGGIAGNIYSNGPITGAQGATITGSATVATSVALDTLAQSTVCNQDQIVGRNDPQIDFAQSFVPSSSRPLFKVSMYIKKIGGSDPPGTNVRIVSDNNGSPSTSPLASESLQANLVTGNYGWVDVTFASPITVTAGQTYWLVIDAGKNVSRHWVWCTDSNNGLGNGVAKYKRDWNSGGSWALVTGDLAFKTYLGAGVGSISNVSVGSLSGNAYANTITDSTITGTAYCQTGSGNNRACDTSQPDPPPLTMPISQGNIDEWKADATAGGIISGDYTVSSNVSLGPREITGNLVMTSNNRTLTVTGTLYVRGNIDISNGSTIRCDTSFGADSCIIIADGWVHIANNGTFQGSGTPGSFLLLITTLACTGSPRTGCTHHDGAVDVHNQATGVVFYAPNGMINLHNGVLLTSATAYKLRLDNTAIIRYDQGVVNAHFSSGPGGSWAFVPGTYTIAR